MNENIKNDSKTLLWLDDFRKPADYVKGSYIISWVKNYEEFCSFINENGLPDVVCFDHDLGEEKSGYDCAKFLVNYCQEHNLDVPEYDIQSSNSVGKDNIRSLMDNWHRFYLENKKEPNIKMTGTISDLRVIKNEIHKTGMAFFIMNGSEFVILPNTYEKFKKLIKDGTEVTITAKKNKEGASPDYIVTEVEGK